jgi:indolepyruvate ferredoxin oxidoreductase alpha subunit
MNIKEVLTAEENEKLFMLGNEAAVRGALEAGVGLASTYPGTPSSEIGDTLSKIAKDAGLYFEFSANEKVALEVAAAAAASGLRSFTFMKHVGMNVAADSFMSLAYTGVKGGMVILSADDPSIFSSQNEQDNRHYARIANVPMLEPSNPQEIKDLMKYGFELSEKFETPVLMRTTTRVSHMRGVVEVGNLDGSRGEKKGFFRRDPKRFVPVPAAAVEMHKTLVEKMEKISEIANKSPLNRIFDRNGKVGVVTSGSAFNYVMDAVEENDLDVNVLKLTISYPFPEGLVLKFVENLESLVVVEEVDPVMEKEVLAVLGKHGLKKQVHGKLDGTFPTIYEYSPDIILEGLSKALNKNLKQRKVSKTEIPIPARPPTFCPGCPHRATYYSVKRAIENLGLEDIVHPSDIGCYTLGVAAPYNAADYLLSMGSSVGTSCGFSKATDQRIVSFIGDSTFFHAGIPPLLNAVHNKNRFVLVILDNRTTAMTGGQPNPGIPVDGMGDKAPEISIEDIVRGTGVKFLKIIDPLFMKKSQETIEEAIKYDGVAVLISRSPCMLIKSKEQKKRDVYSLKVIEEKCKNCEKCLELACPAISSHNGSISIDQMLCRKCNVCLQVCPERAIGVKTALRNQ